MTKENPVSDNYKNYDLFNDIQDVELRNRNRAVVLANIAEDHTRSGFMSPRGATLVIGYFNEIPDADKQDVQRRFQQNMKERGYAFTQ